MQNHDIVALSHEIESARAVFVDDIFVIRLIQNHNDVRRQIAQQFGDFVMRDRGSGRIIRIRNENQLGFVVDFRFHGRQIVLHIVRQRNRVISAIGQHRSRAILHKRRLAENHFIATFAVEKSQREKMNDLVRTVADNQHIGRNFPMRGDFVFQFVATVVGIKPQAIEYSTYRFNGFGRWAEHVFVGSELGDDNRIVQPQFALDIFNRLARHIGPQLGHAFAHQRRSESLTVIGSSWRRRVERIDGVHNGNNRCVERRVVYH